MARGRISGITVEISGDTTGLDKALKGVNSTISRTQSGLNDVNRLLKLDPSNTTLVAQKQQLLSKAIAETAEKLKVLESTQTQVVEQFKRGDIGEDQYLAFQRELEATRGTLNKYKNDLSGLQSEQERLSTNTDRLTKLLQATGKSVDDYADALGSRLVTAIKNGTANADQLKSAVEKIGKAATGGKADISQLNAALDSVDDGQAIQNLIEGFRNAGDSAQDAADDIGSIADVIQGSAIMQAADQLGAVGDKISDLGSAAVDASSEMQSATTKAAAYFGDTGTAAEQSAGTIKNVYESGVGESLDSVSNAVIEVKKNLGDLSDTDMSNITTQALQLDELYGIDMSESLRGANSLMAQYGMSAQEAMDYIVAGTQNGLDKTNELGDNISEYSGKFAQAGYSAQEYFQLLQNGLDGGAYNLDRVNDAINEVTTRLADGTIGDSIGDFSTKTQGLFQAWQDGRATQKDVIDSIVSDIAGCTNQQDQMNMAAAAFGTFAEDGNMKFISSLTSVGNEYDNVSGKAQAFSSQATTPMQELEGNTRKLQSALQPLGEKMMELANTVLPPLIAAITKIGEWFGKLPEPVQNFAIILGVLMVAFAAIAPVIAAAAIAIGLMGTTLLPIIAVIAAVSAAIAMVIAVVKNWGTITQTVSGVVIGIWNALKSAAASVWNGIKTAIINAVNAVKNGVSNGFNAVKITVSSIWNGVKSATSSVWNGIKNTISNVVNGVKNTVSNVFNSVKTTVTNVFNGIKTTATNTWNSIKDAITKPINKAKDAVKTAIDKIKSAFNFSWSLPSLKLPHISVSGSFSINPPSVPHFGISWYKNGGIMTNPTIFGINGSSLMAGGEAGAEAILPLAEFYNRLENILTSRLDTRQAVVDGVNAALAAASASNSTPTSLRVDITAGAKTLASVLWDPLNGVARQKGAAL